MIVPDALSRRPDQYLGALLVEPAARSKFIAAQTADSSDEFLEYVQFASNGDRGFSYQDGVLCRLLHGVQKIVVPLSLREMVIDEFHSSPLSGHLGAYRCVGKISESFWWKSLRDDVRKFIAGC